MLPIRPARHVVPLPAAVRSWEMQTGSVARFFVRYICRAVSHRSTRCLPSVRPSVREAVPRTRQRGVDWRSAEFKAVQALGLTTRRPHVCRFITDRGERQEEGLGSTTCGGLSRGFVYITERMLRGCCCCRTRRGPMSVNYVDSPYTAANQRWFQRSHRRHFVSLANCVRSVIVHPLH